MTGHNSMNKLAIWAVTPNGAALAAKLAKSLPDADLFLSANLETPDNVPAFTFTRLSDALSDTCRSYSGHIFIMSAGIVVRLIAPHIRHKTADPAVVVMDEAGYHAVSLLSGHIGGANALAKKVAEIIGADPVITTATDINNVPAIDVAAKEKNLFIENPDAIKNVSMALLVGKQAALHDPFGRIGHEMNEWFCRTDKAQMANSSGPGVFIDDIQIELPPHVLILRPRSLVAGMGCNRNTGTEEMKSLLYEVLEKFALSRSSLNSIATIDAKKDEPGLTALAEDLELPLIFFDKQALNQVKDIQTPSEMVEKHMGVKSVCEAAAILASKNGTLIVPKHSTRNVTVAIARMSFTL